MNKKLRKLATRIERNWWIDGFYIGNSLKMCGLKYRYLNESCRKVYLIFYGGRKYIMKFSFEENGCQNSREVDIWKASKGLRKHLYKIYAYSYHRKVIIGEYLPYSLGAESKANEIEFDQFYTDMAKIAREDRIILGDFYTHNMRRRQNRKLVISDYGYFKVNKRKGKK